MIVKDSKIIERALAATKRVWVEKVQMAKRVRDAEGGVSQCGACGSTVAAAKPVAARPVGKRPKK